MLGQKSKYVNECRNDNFIGGDFDIRQDLSNELLDNWKDFNEKFIPVWLAQHSGKTKIAAGLSCGYLWTICKGIQIGDIILSPDGKGSYLIGEIISDYRFADNSILPHQRPIKWYDILIKREEMSDSLKKSTGSIGTVSEITKYASEIEGFIKGSPIHVSTDDTIEDPAQFVMEKYLEEFLVNNWDKIEFGKDYDIFEEDGEKVGEQYQTDTGPLDILAVSKDKKTLLVIELKRGRASDVVVGQILRYMGYVKEELAEHGQVVKGIIIALEDDLRIRRALNATENIDFYRYQVSFKLIKQ
jgi:restriction system protein